MLLINIYLATVTHKDDNDLTVTHKDDDDDDNEDDDDDDDLFGVRLDEKSGKALLISHCIDFRNSCRCKFCREVIWL